MVCVGSCRYLVPWLFLCLPQRPFVCWLELSKTPVPAAARSQELGVAKDLSTIKCEHFGHSCMKADPRLCLCLSVCVRVFKSPSRLPAHVPSCSGMGATGQDQDVRLFTDMKNQHNLKGGYQMSKKQSKYKVIIWKWNGSWQSVLNGNCVGAWCVCDGHNTNIICVTITIK